MPKIDQMIVESGIRGGRQGEKSWGIQKGVTNNSIHWSAMWWKDFDGILPLGLSKYLCFIQFWIFSHLKLKESWHKLEKFMQHIVIWQTKYETSQLCAQYHKPQKDRNYRNTSRIIPGNQIELKRQKRKYSFFHVCHNDCLRYGLVQYRKFFH